jgi:hypothetical protein
VKILGALAVGIFLIYLALGPFYDPISDGIRNWRTSGTTLEAHTSVVTGGGITTANVTLAKDLYNANLANVTAVTTNNGSDAPVASVYDEATKNLTISGLLASSTRTVTVGYYGESNETITHAVGPFFGFLVFGGILGAIVYGIVKDSKGRKGSWR